MRDRSPLWYRLRGLIFALIYVAGFIASWIAWRYFALPYHAPQTTLEIGTAFVFLCWALRAWGSAYLHADVVWNPDTAAPALIVGGPFRYTRSPLYLGNLCMAIGIGLLTGPAGFAVMVIGTLAFDLALVRYETEDLKHRFGSIAERYAAAVPPLMPRLTPAHVEGTRRVPPSLGQGIRSEVFTGALTAGMIVLCIFGDRGFPLFTALWVGGWIAQHVVTWNRVPSATPPEP